MRFNMSGEDSTPFRPKPAVSRPYQRGLADGYGADLLPQLRYADGTPIPVVIFSAQSLDDAALAASVNAVLTKSKMSLSELSDAVCALARKGEPDLASGRD